MKTHSIKFLFIFLLATFAAGIIGSFFTFDAIPNYYANLNKPFFSPPNWVFGPVWTTLYVLIGISGYLAWRAKAQVLPVFAVQLALNSLWSILFFGMRMPFLAFLEILLLFAAIAYMMKLFHKADKRAAYLLIPYLLWVGFATLLNLAIVLLN